MGRASGPDGRREERRRLRFDVCTYQLPKTHVTTVHCRHILMKVDSGVAPRQLPAARKHQVADCVGVVGGPQGPGDPGTRGRGSCSGLQGQGRGRGQGRGSRAYSGRAEDKEWVPVTKLGRLAKDMKIKSLEEIYLFSLPIKESEIIDVFLGASRKDEALKIMPVQKQTRAGQRTRFKAFVAIRAYNGHVGLGVKCFKEVATAIQGAIILAKLSIVPARRGYWGNKINKPHTVPCKVTGHCGSVLVHLIPAPRGAGIVSPVPKKLLLMADTDDCYTSVRGCTAALGNFAKATFDAISKTYSYLTPDLWKEMVFTKSPYQEFTDHLVKTHTRVSVQRTQAPAVATTGFSYKKNEGRARHTRIHEATTEPPPVSCRLDVRVASSEWELPALLPDTTRRPRGRQPHRAVHAHVGTGVLLPRFMPTPALRAKGLTQAFLVWPPPSEDAF
ncbi:LOW QUALITY PROTEIN: small ribosomal subunit protein uS5-like [Ctenodactylus gundi]